MLCGLPSPHFGQVSLEFWLSENFGIRVRNFLSLCWNSKNFEILEPPNTTNQAFENLFIQRESEISLDKGFGTVTGGISASSMVIFDLDFQATATNQKAYTLPREGRASSPRGIIWI